MNGDLTALLKEFGPPRRSNHPEYPFWWLQTDGVWVVRADGPLEPRQGNNDAKKSELLAKNAHGGFTAAVRDAITADPTLVAVIAGRLLDSHFPVSIHPDLLAAVGLDIAAPTAVCRAGRAPHFREKILVAYEYRCAGCGFDVRLGSHPVGLEAAHIRWHNAGGPDVEENGLALCVLHHKLLDLGAYTLDPHGQLLVSDRTHGTDGFHDGLLRYHGRKVRLPQRPEQHPSARHLEWHGREAFKGQPRHVG